VNLKSKLFKLSVNKYFVFFLVFFTIGFWLLRFSGFWGVGCVFHEFNCPIDRSGTCTFNINDPSSVRPVRVNPFGNDVTPNLFQQDPAMVVHLEPGEAVYIADEPCMSYSNKEFLMFTMAILLMGIGLGILTQIKLEDGQSETRNTKMPS